MDTHPKNNENISVVQAQVQTLHLVICDDKPEQIELMTEMLQGIEQETPFVIETFLGWSFNNADITTVVHDGQRYLTKDMLYEFKMESYKILKIIGGK